MNLKLLGQRIRQAREESGLSQHGLGKLISKDQRAISEYEKGSRKIAAIEIPALASALNVTPSYFFDEQSHLDDLDAVMLYEFQQLYSDESKQTIIDIVRMLRKSIEIGQPDDAD